MSKTFGRYGATHPRLGRLGYALGLQIFRRLCAKSQMYEPDSAYAQERRSSMQQKLQRGEPVFLLGFGPAGHNAGAALVEVHPQHGITLHCNNEEERFTGQKHFSGYPELSTKAVCAQLASLGLKPQDLHACVANYDFVSFFANHVRGFLEEWPWIMRMVSPKGSPPELPTELRTEAYGVVFQAAELLGKQMDRSGPFPIIGMGHHGNHAYFSYAMSPFASSPEPVMVTVLDGSGDEAAISLYVGRGGRLELSYCNHSSWDSLGFLYGVLSSTQGGWHMLSSEGRYMGAAAWGDSNRLTNPYYRRLRQLLYFSGDGQIYLNRQLANWPRAFLFEPYTKELTEILGPPISLKQMWQPDVILKVEDIQHAEITQERVDKAAATQLVFEDGLFHIVEHLIRKTGSNKLVVTGGTALNCVANMRLLTHFDEAWFQRHTGRSNTRLELWVPPVPGDAGVPAGAAYQFGMLAGGRPGASLQHAFYCGAPPSTQEILAALCTESEVGYLALGEVRSEDGCARIADLMAYIVSQDGIVGLYQGSAETGPRALGHRSILANPCNPKTRENLNRLVKFRELIRPLAPMATLDAAQRYFELSSGAMADDYNAYRYMILTAKARPEAHGRIPAVIHHDGTGRVQIVRQQTDPFTYAYLKAMGRRVGVEVSVNTSLNVGSPIVQSPQQALSALKRSLGMDGLFLIGATGEAFLAWHAVATPPKDGGARLRSWIDAWKQQSGASL